MELVQTPTSEGLSPARLSPLQTASHKPQIVTYISLPTDYIPQVPIRPSSASEQLGFVCEVWVGPKCVELPPLVELEVSTLASTWRSSPT